MSTSRSAGAWRVLPAERAAQTPSCTVNVCVPPSCHERATNDNEANNNEAEMQGEEVPAAAAESSTEKVRLPVQLNRLPADRLLKVHQAFQELQDAGLSEVPDLSQLSKVETVVEIEKVDKEEEDKKRQSQRLHWSL
eukprot:symbB.v1.2.033821.t1/scaffold4249.1/size57077/1